MKTTVEKTKEEILSQLYITATDLKILMPTVGINECRKKIKDYRSDMEAKNYYVPPAHPLVALTKLVKKDLGI